MFPGLSSFENDKWNAMLSALLINYEIIFHSLSTTCLGSTAPEFAQLCKTWLGNNV